MTSETDTLDTETETIVHNKPTTTPFASGTQRHTAHGDHGGNHCKRKRKRKRQRLDPSSSKVVVVGAGLAGLSVALSLKRAGFANIEVHERDPSLSYQKEGYGLTLTYNPKGPLEDLGILEAVAERDCPSRSHYLFRQEPAEPKPETPDTSRNGNNNSSKTAIPMGYFGNAFVRPSAVRRGYGQRGNLRVPRKVLRKILHDTLLEKEPWDHHHYHQQQQSEEQSTDFPSVRWNSSFVDFKWDPSAQQYHVRFASAKNANGNNDNDSNNEADKETTTVVADLLVAADGIRSAVLQQLYHRKLLADDDDEAAASAATPGIEEELVAASAPSKPSPPCIREFPERYGLRPMGIRLILGIADGIDHPLLRERGFYTVDTHGHRLFTMPYESNRFALDDADGATTTTANRIMWQLSFAAPSDPESLDPEALRGYVLETFRTWHPPVLNLVESTPPSGIWGTDLVDRDPRKLYRELVVGEGGRRNPGTGGSAIAQPRLAVCGDALHSMSPFKGQGANQALADGPLLARWLSRSSVDAALTGWWRETLNRTAPVVEASRKAARDWHDPSKILGGDDNNSEYHGFAGVRLSARSALVGVLANRAIGPHLGAGLDRAIREVVSEHGWFDEGDGSAESTLSESPPSPPLDPGLCDEVLDLAARGDTAGFRRMSLPSSSSSSSSGGGDRHHLLSCRAMVEARDSFGRSCLHLAARGSHRSLCKWLLTELRIPEQWKGGNEDDDATSGGGGSGGKTSAGAGGDPNRNEHHELRAGPTDKFGNTAYDCAKETGNKELIYLFEVVLRENKTRYWKPADENKIESPF